MAVKAASSWARWWRIGWYRQVLAVLAQVVKPAKDGMIEVKVAQVAMALLAGQGASGSGHRQGPGRPGSTCLVAERNCVANLVIESNCVSCFVTESNCVAFFVTDGNGVMVLVAESNCVASLEGNVRTIHFCN